MRPSDPLPGGTLPRTVNALRANDFELESVRSRSTCPCSMWVALEDVIAEKPGTTPKWQLAVKHGRDGKALRYCGGLPPPYGWTFTPRMTSPWVEPAAQG